jgi:hypothetical protein
MMTKMECTIPCTGNMDCPAPSAMTCTPNGYCRCN